MSIEKQVLEQVVPTVEEEQELHRTVEDLRRVLLAEARKRGLEEVEVMLVGSIAKGTYLRGALDIDLFVLYPPAVNREDIKRHTLAMGKAVLEDWQVQYAEHPYVRGTCRGYRVDVVPCYRVSSTAAMQSAVDRTPFHTRFIRDHLKTEQKDQVRLLKQFLKGIGCYGAEVRVQGFSGYLAELLVLRYGSFRGVLEAGRRWEGEETLYLEGTPRGAEFEESFVFIDPVDPSRNVAAALAPDRLRRFIHAAGAYLRRPRLTFFFPEPVRPWLLPKLAARLQNFIGVEMPRPEVIDDIVYSQARKGAGSLATLLREHDFTVLGQTFFVDDYILLAVELESRELSPTTLHCGPPREQREHAENFLQKWEGHSRTVGQPFVKEERWWVEIEREYTTAGQLLEAKLPELSLGKHLDRCKDRASVLEGEQLAVPRYAAFWTDYLSGLPPWERG
ncbi:MAG: CCA tRNA nucleotidyltransferase [Candidatus Thermoplasmatota archaeon]|nr:CCA tRNA nucleotidyltransferase [Candidatus Thermoplasmatota archaeon]